MKYLVLIISLLLLISCNSKSTSTVDELFETDKKFSQTSTEIGFNKAFLKYAHDSAVLLRENSMPLVGKPTLEKIFKDAQAEGIDFTWEPLDGDIAESGELGYTYGIFTLKRDTVIETGTYVSIWKKDNDGNWKYVLDTGNKGLGK